MILVPELGRSKNGSVSDHEAYEANISRVAG